MSDTERDANDDGGIDKEALREELREKYEREEREREATARMSDLLLKGATMTNSHCGACGDPLFRQNGVEFCPSCHGSPAGVEASVEDNETTGGVESDRAVGDEVAAGQTTPDEVATDQRTPDEVATGQTTHDEVATDETLTPDRSSPPAPDRAGAAPGIAPDAGDDSTREFRQEEVTGPNTEPSRPATEGSLAESRSSLENALRKFAARAAETDDPRQARECLEAARAAAEALEALR